MPFGEAIHKEGRADRAGCPGKRPDEVGARQTQTRRAGLVWDKSIGLRLVRATSPNFDEALDLVPNHRRQNGSIQARNALTQIEPRGDMLTKILAATALFALTMSAASAATVSRAYSYFPVTGGTLEEIEQELLKFGPKVESSGQRHPGATRMKFSMRIRYKEEPGRCEIVKADVSVKATVILPKWRQPKGVDNDVRLFWDTLRADIKRHEESHIIIAKNHARALEEKLVTIVAPDCKQAAERSKATMAQVLARLEKAQDYFDRVESVNFESRMVRLMLYRLQQTKARDRAAKTN
ncbi:DUF922 domain-containing protein [Mesorhizobium sp. LHD-90]|uniref:DUF922 domain-containing Zn-dependent protease n=1 Tax=Mesorhizobium sp. LHD-90 TaxID=3071414 RepID=UPI0027DFA3D2|nr:DUF922 domain-containing protein [Mesorhizobium sp. LHD-90]MDQ6437837.1 DUF922 domain-containing protein [Mesorhizobium sp. LHD-90]